MISLLWLCPIENQQCNYPGEHHIQSGVIRPKLASGDIKLDYLLRWTNGVEWEWKLYVSLAADFPFCSIQLSFSFIWIVKIEKGDKFVKTSFARIANGLAK
jgi:hypothetical protein